jgi:preprotein translocase subunit SecA
MSEAAPLYLPLVARALQAEREVKAPHWTEKLVTAGLSHVVARAAPLRARRLRRILPAVERHAARIATLSAAAILQEARATGVALRRDRGLDDIARVGRAFALVREVAGRTLGIRHYDVQLLGGYALVSGALAEMATGEGKTLTATLAAATAALAGLPVHVVTVNDYLAGRDAELMAPVYEALGLRVATVLHGQSPEERRRAYRAHVTYATNKELAFDYLRDRIALGATRGELRLRARRFAGDPESTGALLLRGLHFAIVDEADSIFIDEARTPLLISGAAPPDERIEMAEDALAFATGLEEGRDFTLQRSQRRADLTRRGRDRAVTETARFGGLWGNEVLREEMTCLALAALHLFRRDEAYIVRDGKVQIVDEFTGRVMADRSWGEGLHQLVELKEGVEPTRPRVPLARITYQRFFRRYRRLSGMTGTAAEIAREVWSVFRLPVLRIPTNRPCRRVRFPDRILRDADAKWRAVAARCRELHEAGRPVLVGTRSVAASGEASAHLAAAGLPHQILSAAQDADEAAIVAEAGQPGRITVATNMAGRGTDILLGPGVEDRGGLHVLMTERHEAARIDRQLAGRCARQGNRGSVEAILSLDDPLLAHSPYAVAGTARNWLGGALAARWAMRRAQLRAERIHRHMRLRLLRQDEQLATTLSFSGKPE